MDWDRLFQSVFRWSSRYNDSHRLQRLKFVPFFSPKRPAASTSICSCPQAARTKRRAGVIKLGAGSVYRSLSLSISLGNFTGTGLISKTTTEKMELYLLSPYNFLKQLPSCRSIALDQRLLRLVLYRPPKISTFLRTILSVKCLQDKYVRVFYGHVCLLILLGFCLKKGDPFPSFSTEHQLPFPQQNASSPTTTPIVFINISIVILKVQGIGCGLNLPY